MQFFVWAIQRQDPWTYLDLHRTKITRSCFVYNPKHIVHGGLDGRGGGDKTVIVCDKKIQSEDCSMTWMGPK